MCGYIGGRKDVLEEHGGIEHLIGVQSHRGKDGYGFIAMHKDSKILYLKSMSLKSLAKSIEKLEGNPFVIVHHRATSVGGTKLSLAHPLAVTHDDEEGKRTTLLMQNGTNKNPYTMVKPSGSDSEALAMLVDIMEPEDFAKYVLQDVGVVIYAKNGGVYLHRDDERPLNIHESGLLASEPIIEGVWQCVDLQHSQISFDGTHLQGVDTSSSADIKDIGDVALCSFCNKKHYVPAEGTVCNACVVEGIPQKKGWHRAAFNYMDVDDYSDDYYTGNWSYSGMADEYLDIPAEDMRVVYRIFGSSISADEPTYYKKYGVPVKVDDEIYLIPRNTGNTNEARAFLIEEIRLPEIAIMELEGGFVPNKSPAKTIESSVLWPYWNTTASAYDLQRDIYYLNATLLDDGDKQVLEYSKYYKGYAIPHDYAWGQ